MKPAAALKYLTAAGIPVGDAQKLAGLGIDWKSLFDQFKPMLLKILTDILLKSLGSGIVPPASATKKRK